MQYKLKIQKNETLKISTIQLLQLSTEENELLQLLDKSSTFVTDFFGEGEITEYRLLHSSSQHTAAAASLHLAGDTRHYQISVVVS